MYNFITMEDNKLKPQPGQPKQPEVPSTPKVEVKKEDIAKNAQEQQTVFGSTGSEDINKNIGNFTNTVVSQDTSVVEPIKLDVDAKVVEQASKEKIDFERFTRTQRGEKAAKTKFGEKVSLMLRSKKGLRTTWIIELVMMAVIIAVGIGFIVWISKLLGQNYAAWTDPSDNCKACAKVGRVFLWISLFPCVIPLVYLLTTWFIGINQVASSKIFHYMMWICLIICLTCLIIGLGCLIKPLVWTIPYQPL